MNLSLYEVPVNAKGYANNILNVRIEDVPPSRLHDIKEVIRKNEDIHSSLMAARVLTNWGDSEGFHFLTNKLFEQKECLQWFSEHRLRGYNDIVERVLHDFIGYWANKSSSGFEQEARNDIFKSIGLIINMSSKMPFEIQSFFWLIEEEGYYEYIPLLKNHLEEIIKNPNLHHWKVADCAHLLMKFDPEFVKKILATHGYTLADFPDS